MSSQVLAAFIGLVAGAVGSLIAPWVNWGVEKRRKRHSDRQTLIAYARGHIGSPTFDLINFKQETLFRQLRPHLPGTLVETVLAGAKGSGVSDAESVRDELLEELAGLERRWHLM